VKSTEQKKKLLAMLEKFSVSKDEARKSHLPWWSSGNIPAAHGQGGRRGCDRVVEDFMERDFPKYPLKSVRP